MKRDISLYGLTVLAAFMAAALIAGATQDGNIRHELLPNGRYNEARGRRKVRIKDAIG